jgi:hypothetical protein
MNRREIPIGKQSRGTWIEIEDDFVERLDPGFHGAVVLSDLNSCSIKCELHMDRDGAALEPHEAIKWGEALIAAAHDVAAYKVKP